jgi:hypothetical protein
MFLHKVITDILRDSKKFETFDKCIRLALKTEEDSSIQIMKIYDILSNNQVISRSPDEKIIQIQQLLIEDYIKFLDDKASIIDYSVMDKVYFSRTGISNCSMSEYQKFR